MHDFIIPKLGRTVPYGVYDIAGDVGWGSVEVDHDTAAFAVNVIHKRRHQEVRVEFDRSFAGCLNTRRDRGK